MIQCLSLLACMALVLFIAIFLVFVPPVSNRISGIFTSGTLEETISSFMANSLVNRAIGIDVYSWLKIRSSSSFAPTPVSAVILTFSCSSIWASSVKWSSSLCWWKLAPLLSEKLALIWKACSIGCLLYWFTLCSCASKDPINSWIESLDKFLVSSITTTICSNFYSKLLGIFSAILLSETLSPQLLIWLIISVVLKEKSLTNSLSFIVRFSSSFYKFCNRIEMASQSPEIHFSISLMLLLPS